MPGLVRKLVIFATIDGLILQAHGPVEHHHSLRVDYRTRSITPWKGSHAELHKQPQKLETHGIIGQYFSSRDKDPGLI